MSGCFKSSFQHNHPSSQADSSYGGHIFVNGFVDPGFPFSSNQAFSLGLKRMQENSKFPTKALDIADTAWIH